MRRWKAILSVLLAATYTMVTTGGSLRLVLPSKGSGNPGIQQQRGESREAPRPVWMPRRHLPMIKVLSLDQRLAPVQLLSVGLDRILIPVSHAAFSVSEEHFGSPSPPRAPPVGILAA